MTELRVRRDDFSDLDAVSLENPVPVEIEGQPVAVAPKATFHTGFIPIPGIGVGVAYAAGDAFGDKFSVPVPKSGIVQTALMLDMDDEGVATEIWLFRQDFTATADNAAFSPSDADLEKIVGVIEIVTFFDAANNQVGQADGIGKAYTALSGQLYAQCVTRGAPNIAAANLPKVALMILPDAE